MMLIVSGNFPLASLCSWPRNRFARCGSKSEDYTESRAAIAIRSVKKPQASRIGCRVSAIHRAKRGCPKLCKRQIPIDQTRQTVPPENARSFPH